jgi:putative hydrolase of the HAD superfamily
MSGNSSSSGTQAVLFDLGGVVLEIDFGRAFAHWQARSRLAPEHIRERFGVDEPYELHETGGIDAQAYFAHLREHLQLEDDAGFIHEGWNSIFVGEIAETVAVLKALRERVPCYALSNTNAAHLAHMQREFPQVLAQFRKVFVSHEIGHRKPQPRAFEHVVREMGVAPGQVLFFDDLAENVEAARECGLQAVQVQGPADVRGALRERGLL